MQETDHGLDRSVTIAFVFRERITPTITSLKHIINMTTEPHDLIVFDDASPAAVANELRRLAAVHGFLLLRSNTQTPPNDQRNACLARVRTPFVVFVDNDITVESGWLAALLACARETGAGLVMPLYLENAGGRTRIHMFGGDVRLRTDDGVPAFDERHHYQHSPLDKNRHELVRSETNLVEFHTVLADTDLLRSLGGLDPHLKSMAEHADLSVRVRQAGRSIFREPASVVTYHIPPRLDPADRNYFQQRWSEVWNVASAHRIAQLYGLSESNSRIRDIIGWARSHRQKATLRFSVLRYLMGRRLHDRIIRRLVSPLELRMNRWRYPV